ncbi:MAG: methicillin resistance protein, partial [Deltaproteobacteria bacterium]|nr:methicillin resistance protein [Deltaproteobacteria bacterium]
MKSVGWLQPEDMPEWDAFVEGHPFGWISHLSLWKDVLERSFGHIKGHFLAVRDDKQEKIIAGIPIYTVKSWLTGNRLVSVPFLTHCEALISSPEDMEKLLPPILGLYADTRASYIKLNTWRSASLIQEQRLKNGQGYKHHYITLDSTPEDLRKKFHKTSVRQPI